MGILDDLLTRVQRVNDGMTTGEMVRDVVIRHPGDIMELQREQLFAGLAANGKDIRPYYSEDLKPGGYFHSTESAKRYANWKSSGISYPSLGGFSRNIDAPNLYINGKFHSELDVQFNAQTVGIIGRTTYAKGIIAKYGQNTFGLMASNWGVIFVERGAYNELLNNIKTILYGN